MADAHAAERLRSFVARVERLEEERKALVEDIGEVYSEAKGEGFDTKVMRQVVARRRMDAAERGEVDVLLDMYERAVNGKREADDPLA